MKIVISAELKNVLFAPKNILNMIETQMLLSYSICNLDIQSKNNEIRFIAI